MPRYYKDASGNVVQDYTGIDMLPMQSDNRMLDMQRESQGLDSFGFPTQRTANNNAVLASQMYGNISGQRDASLARIMGQPATADEARRATMSALPLSGIEPEDVGRRQYERLSQIPGGADFYRSLTGSNNESLESRTSADGTVRNRTGIRTDFPTIITDNVGGDAMLADKKIRGDNLEMDLLHHPKFKQLQTLHPELAAQTYEAVTGRALAGDVDAKKAQIEAQQKFQQTMAAELAKNVTIATKDIMDDDGKTVLAKAGEPVKQITKFDAMGISNGVQKVPLTRHERLVYDTPGLMKSATGFDTPEGIKRDKLKASEIMRKEMATNPNPKKRAIAMADLVGSNDPSVAPPTTGEPPPAVAPKPTFMARRTADVMNLPSWLDRTAYNAAVGAHNAYNTNPRSAIPLAGSTPEIQALQARGEAGSVFTTASDLLGRLLYAPFSPNSRQVDDSSYAAM